MPLIALVNGRRGVGSRREKHSLLISHCIACYLCWNFDISGREAYDTWRLYVPGSGCWSFFACSRGILLCMSVHEHIPHLGEFMSCYEIVHCFLFSFFVAVLCCHIDFLEFLQVWIPGYFSDSVFSELHIYCN